MSEDDKKSVSEGGDEEVLPDAPTGGGSVPDSGKSKGEPEEAKPEEAKPEEAKPEEAKPEEEIEEYPPASAPLPKVSVIPDVVRPKAEGVTEEYPPAAIAEQNQIKPPPSAPASPPSAPPPPTPPGGGEKPEKGGLDYNPLLEGRDLRASRIRRYLLALAAPLLLIIGALYVVPLFIDWDAQKQELIDNARQITGREMVIEGNISFEVFPLPSLNIKAVRLKNAEWGASEFMATVDSVKVEPSLLALIFGKVKIAKLTLNNATFELENFADAGPNWDFHKNRKLGEVTKGRDVADNYLSIKDIVINGGKIFLRTGYKAEPKEKLLYIDNAVVNADSFTGPFEAVGDFRSGNQAFNFELETDDLSDDEADFELGVFTGKSEIKIDGEVRDWDSKPVLAGKLSASIDRSIDSFLDHAGINQSLLPKALSTIISNKTTEIKAVLLASADGATLNDMTLNSISTKGKGSIEATFSKVNNIKINLDIEYLDVDKLMEDEPAAQVQKSRSEIDAQVLAEFAAESRDKKKSVDIGENTKFIFNISVAQAKFRGQTVSDMHLETEMGQGQTLVKTLSAKNLPGQMDIDVSGTLFRADEKTGQEQRFESRIKAKGKDLQPVFSWLKISGLPALKPDVMKDFSFDADISFTPDKVGVSRVVLEIDDVYIIGQAALAKGENQTGVNSAFRVSRLDLDKYLMTTPSIKLFNRELSEAELGQEVRRFDFLRSLQGFYKNFSMGVQIDELLFDGNQFRDFELVFSLRPGFLEVKKLNFNSFMGALAASGSVNTKELTPALQISLSIEDFDTAYLSDFSPDAKNKKDKKGKLSWSTEKFYLNRLKAYNGEMQMKYDRLNHGRLPFRAVTSALSWNRLGINMRSFRAKLFEGNVDMKGDFGLDIPSVGISYSLANADLSQAFSTFFGADDLVERGRVSISGNFTTSGHDMLSMASNLSGASALTARGLTINGFDLENLASEADSYSGFDDLKAFTANALAKGSSDIDYVSGNSTMSKGIWEFDNFTMTHSLFSNGAFNAQINLPEWAMSLNARMSLDMGRLSYVSLGLNAAGPIARVGHRWDTKEIERAWERNFYRPQ